MKNTIKTIWIITFIAIIGLGFAGCKDHKGSDYKIGDTGPGGGLVFYDKGKYSNGWRYMEVAPVSTEVVLGWGKNVYSGEWPPNWEDLDQGKVLTANGIGTGAANTEVIVAMLSTHKVSDRAALYCYELVYGGKDDWFLPSKDELYEVYRNLAAKGLGDFPNHSAEDNSDADWYWSSSQYNNYKAWSLNTGDDLHGRWEHNLDPIGKPREQGVRAIRAF